MNHFLLASDRYPRKVPLLASAAGRYGVQAMELLINGLLKLGAQRGNLRAKAFGGGNVLQDWRDTGDAFLAIGDANIRFVREFLSTDRIPLVASDLGGCFGRQVHFDGSDYSVYVRKIETAPSRQVVEQERIYLRQDLERHQREAGHQQVEYW